MNQIGSATSRRALLGALAATPIAAAPMATGTPPDSDTLFAPSFASTNEAFALRRTMEGRSLSRFRYHNAENFFPAAGRHVERCDGPLLYQLGITLQLGLSSHLLDVGFDDMWCARNVGLEVARSLAYSNATGLGHDCPELRRLADLLSPYCKWRDADVSGHSGDCPFSGAQAIQLTRALLDRVREVTGHPRPRLWRRRSFECC